MSDAVPNTGSGGGGAATPLNLDKLLKRLWVPHPSWGSGVRPRIAPLPSPEQLTRWGKKLTVRYLWERHKAMKAAKLDPLWHGWEPPSWTLWDCLLGMWWVDAKLAEEVRTNLGFVHPLFVLWLFGANRASKSMYSARTCTRILFGKAGMPPPVEKVVTVFGETEQWSRKHQQTKMHFFMPEPFRSASKGKGFKTTDGIGYIKYLGVRGGFPDNMFVTPTGSYCEFKFYAQSEDSHEGGAQDAVWCSELVSADLVDKLKRGLSDRQGKMIVDFTPIQGYSPAVRMAMASAVPALSSPAFLIPEDGGEPDVEAAMYVEDVVWRVRMKQLEVDR